MSWTIELVRTFNARVPLPRVKNRLAKWAAARMPAPAPGEVPREYGGVQGGLRMVLDVSVETERWMYLNNYEVAVVALLRKLLRPGDTFVDAGTYVGLMSLVASRRVGPTGRVFSFEPTPSTLQRLRRNVELNAASNVTIIPKGCWDSAGEAVIHEFSGEEPGSNSLGIQGQRQVERESRVATARIDAEVSGPVRLMKVDVEGAELHALRGAKAILDRSRPHLIIELNPQTTPAMGYQPIETLDWLLREYPQYRVHVVGRRSVHPSSREEVARRLVERAHKHCDVWLAP